MSILIALISVAAPGASDIQALEVTRVIGPYASPARDGRLHAEFAPSVETRGAVCEPVGGRDYACRYERRTKGFFDSDFGVWEAASVRLQRKKGRWRVVDPGD
ncbi:MAG: hypothetical protein JNL35_12480 [Sphingopyxis sp.]|nr:hypothetical protein [Sphingopyxis sp.]